MKILQSVLLMSLMGASLAVLANMTPTESLTKKLQAIDSYRANFEQTIQDADGEIFSKSLGVVKVLRPGRFIWDTKMPSPVLIVADGKTIWTYDVDLEQVVKQDATKTLNGSPAALLAGELIDLTKEFNVSHLEQSQCKRGVEECFHLTPKNPDPLFSKVLIGFKNNQLTTMQMDDALGQHIDMRFSDIQVNTKLDKKLFVFTPPKNVDIIQNYN